MKVSLDISGEDVEVFLKLILFQQHADLKVCIEAIEKDKRSGKLSPNSVLRSDLKDFRKTLKALEEVLDYNVIQWKTQYVEYLSDR